MKPVHLSLAGLQSYRERVDIDFERLYEAGVFGIFGPTGSGKSTILDAMTLALYGKVERAANGTQGIMNMAEDKMSVSFAFELVHHAGSERYRVERTFKRTGEATVSASAARLVQLHPEERVLADKARDVDAEVEALIGLTMQDFTRAVVLPQGKFAEFLQLKGSDRRQMLQRLFRLERYGDELAMKLSSRLKSVDAERKQAEAELLGLGDASEDALRQARQAVEASAEAAGTAKARVSALEAEYKQLEQWIGWRTELEQLDRRLAEHRLRLPDMLELERRLALAAKAELIRPYHEQYRHAQGADIHSGRRLEAAEAARSLAAEAFRTAEHAHEQARLRRESEEPGLHRRREQLETARMLEQETVKRAEELIRLEIDCNEAAESAKGKRTELAAKRELLEKALGRQAEVKAALAAEERPETERRRLLEAWEAAKDIRLQAKLADDAERELAADQQTLDRLRRDLERLRNELSGFDALRMEAVRASELLSRIDAASAACMPALAELKRRLAAALKAEETRVAAARLAEQLQDGSPCPVCGAETHPHPAAHAEGGDPERIGTLERLASRAEEALARAQAMSLDLERRRLGWERLKSSLPEERTDVPIRGPLPDAAMPDSISIEQAFKEAASALSSHAADETEHAAAEWLTHYDSARQLTERLLEELERSRERADARLPEAKDVLAQRERLDVELSTRAAALAASEARILEQRQAIGRSWAAWSERYPEWAQAEIEREAERLRESDERLADLRRRLHTSEEFIAETRSQAERLQQAVHEAESRERELGWQLEQLRKLQAEQTALLRERVGEHSVEHALREAGSRLRRLADDAEAKRAALEEARAAMQAADAEWNGAREMRAANRERLEAAAAAWTSRLEASDFPDESSWAAALMPDEQRAAVMDETESYREKEKEWTSARAALADKLGDRDVSAEDGLRKREQLQEAKREEEAAIQQEARARRDLEQLQDKHGRWLELRRELEAKSELYGRLQKLQSVFRGNAFVEFLAEEQLMQVSRAASARLGQLTRNRYALEVDSGGGFVIRDQMNGGVRRPVSSLSGGETFLTSLSLALALSAQIQLRGTYPLQFFFLDEGFGTLDPDLLEAVVGALERLHLDRLTVGVISHVPELRARLPRRLVVEPADMSGRGSRVTLETL